MKRFITYDDSCNFCRGVVRFLKKHDRKEYFIFLPLQSDEGEELVRKAGLPEIDINTVVYYTGDRYYLRSTAVLNILKDTHSIWSLAYAGMIFPRPVRDWVYKLVARYRYNLGNT